jgi:TolA-binding protein
MIMTARNWFSVLATIEVIMILVNISYVRNNCAQQALSRNISDKDRFLNVNNNNVNTIADLKRQLARAEEQINTLQQQQQEQQQQSQRRDLKTRKNKQRPTTPSQAQNPVYAKKYPSYRHTRPPLPLPTGQTTSLTFSRSRNTHATTPLYILEISCLKA